MPSALLTKDLIDAIPLPASGYVEWTDAKVGGLTLRIFATGKKPWSIRYRPIGSTTKKRYPLGDYPYVTPDKARKAAEAIRGQRTAGADPAAEREAIKESRRREEAKPVFTFDNLVDLYLADAAKRKASWRHEADFLRRDARPYWGDKRPNQITKADCAARLLEIVKRGAPVAANRTRAAIQAVFNLAVDQGLLETSPMLGVKKPTREKKDGVDRTLTDAELVILWRAVDNAKLAPGIKGALQVLALTGQRPNEIAGLQISDLRHLDNPAEALAEMPAAKMKGRRKHVWAIAEPVARIIKQQIERQVEEAQREGRPVGDHIFTSKFADKQRIARHSLSQALRRVIPALDPNGPDGDIVRRLQADPPTPHAFRRTSVSGMARLGIPREDRKAVVAHAEDDVLAGHYDAYDRLREKRIALDAWARHVEDLLSGEKQTGAVVPFARRMS